ncbi:phosphoglycerate mutase-like protein isoform X3 [Carex rostrata]
MEGTTSTGMYPLHRCKILHLVRHAQGIHNVAGEKDFGSYLSNDYLDAHLTDLGWSQVDNLRMHVQRTGLVKKIELVITSPLLRTMQTAVGVFGGEGFTDGTNEPPLMIQNAFNSGRPAVSSLGAPPFLAVESCREHLGEHPCDKRRSITEYRPVFPAIDFSLASRSYSLSFIRFYYFILVCDGTMLCHMCLAKENDSDKEEIILFFLNILLPQIQNDEDVLWKPDVRETNEEITVRGAKFINWLWTREEKEIAIVSHSGFLYQMLSNFGKDCHPVIQEEITKQFANCELRSMVLVDRSMMGMAASGTNHPGKTPPGLDKPSDQSQ